jgi:hypothetical protein
MNQEKTKIFLVIPTIRDLLFLKNWKSEFKDCHLLIVEDFAKPTIKVPVKGFKSISRFTWEDIDRDFGKNSWVFSRHNSGIRSYGFWKAYKMGADVIITLDDDCYPTSDSFVEGHLSNLSFKLPDSWVNTYPSSKWMYTRGFPYSGRNKYKTFLSHGIWSGALDLDGITETKLPTLLKEKKYPSIRHIIPFGNYYSMCSMNLAFKREVVPILFFPMMGMMPNGKSWPYDRFDDIWAGIFSKKIMDHLEMGVVNGSPIVEHRKASKPKTNLLKESTGMKINEIIWKKVDEVNLTKNNPKDCYIELANKTDFPKNNYFKKLKEAMLIWANLF